MTTKTKNEKPAAAAETTAPVGSNAAQLEGAAVYRKQHDPVTQPCDDNPSLLQQTNAMKQAIGLLAYACDFGILVPDVTGEVNVEVLSDDQNGEVETYTARRANRFGKMQRGLLNQVLRQLDYTIGADEKEKGDTQRDIRNMMASLQRRQDPSRLMDAIEGKTRYVDALNDRIAHAQALRDAADEAYFDLLGTTYTPYEARAPRELKVPVAAGEPTDPRLAAAMAALKS